MRSTTLTALLVLSAALALFVGACNNQTESRLFATMNWKMRCPDAADFANGCSMGCTEGLNRGVNNFAGVEGVSISCNVTEQPTSRSLNFRIGTSSGQSVSFQNVAVPTTGGSALSGTVRFREDNDYTGLAGPGQPCQVTNVTFTREDTSGGDTVIRGSVLCRAMRADADNRICRGLTDPNGPSGTAVGADFEIFACPGLVISAP
jgi:hypothetical protein